MFKTRISVKIESAILIFFGLAYFVNLGQSGFARMNDEGLYAQIASEMFSRGDWVIPTWFGQEAYYKPPLLYWSMFPFLKIFGTNLLAARIPSVFAALLTLWLTYLLAKRIANQEGAIFAPLILATSLSFVRYARTAMMEPFMMLAFVANLYALYRAHQNDKGSWVFWWWASLGASCLVKGPVSVLILVLTALSFSTLTRNWKWFAGESTAAGIGIAIALILIWPLLIYQRGEWSAWWDAFVVRENFGKFHDLFYYSPNNLWKRFLVHLIPWPFFFLAALWVAFEKKRWKEGGILLNLCFLASFFSVFALPAARLYHYPITALPSAALLIGAIYPAEKESRVFRSTSLLTGIITIFGGALVLLSVFFVGLSLASAFAFLAGVCVIAAGVILERREGLIRAAGWMAAAYFFCFVMSGVWNFPVLPQECKNLISDSPVCVARQSPYLWSYETGRRVVQVENGEACGAFLKQGGIALALASDLHRFSIEGLSPKNYRVLCAWPAIRRDYNFHDFMLGLRQRDKSVLEEKMYLLGRR